METLSIFNLGQDETATQRPGVTTDIQKRTCRCCGKELPVSQFYSNGTSYYKRCKSCMTAARKLTRIYNQCSMLPVAQWSQELIELIQLFMTYKETGGKIDYSGDCVEEAIERYAAIGSEEVAEQQDMVKQLGLEEAVSLAFTRIATLEHNYNLLVQAEQEVAQYAKKLQDKVISYQAEVTEYNKKLKSIEKKLDKVTAKSETEKAKQAKNDETKQRRRRADLLNKINNDKRLQQVYDPQELGDLIQCFKDAYNVIQLQGYLPSTELWHLVAMLEMKEQSLTTEMETFYEDFLKPGIEAAKLREDYGLMQGDVVDHVFGDYYDLDWHGIPYKFE